MTVALVDTRWGGHHPTYLREFTASLLRIGARVILLCQKPEEIISPLPAETSARVHGHHFIHRNHGVIDRRRDHDPASTLLRWRATGAALREAEAASGWRADLVFFCYLDSYLRFAPFPQIPGILLGRPWSGLYFRNAHLGAANARSINLLRRAAKGDGLLASPDCRAVCVLDERFNETLAALCGRPVISFPDMTDEAAPDAENPLARRILGRAAGRRIIGMISMEKRKGLITLLRCAIRAHERGEPWFFVATGPFLRGTFTPEELAFCDGVSRRIETGGLDNLYFDTCGGRIQDGVPYNSLFTGFDLVWAAYEGFEGSSNALTKAAAFRKPVLATAGECIGARVERHQLGRTFPEGDVAAALEAIHATLAAPAPEDGFSTYHQLHSRDRLDEVFRGLLHC
jgi:glycosyltransferase involved in cell wall biosynthesis